MSRPRGIGRLIYMAPIDNGQDARPTLDTMNQAVAMVEHALDENRTSLCAR
jgi:hypothetical protein